MKTRVTLALIALASIPVAAMAADERNVSCITDIVYSQEFLKLYPNAPKACRDVIVKDGKKYVHFVGKVTGVKGSELTVSMQNTAGDSLGELTFAPKPDATLKLDGKDVKYSSLQRGQDIDFYLPEGRVDFYAEPGAAAMNELPIVKRTPAK